MLSKIFLLALAVVSVSAASVSDETSIARRSIGSGTCLRRCPNGRRKGWRFWRCECNPGFGGACCNECVTDPIETVDIDLDEFVRATWYVQKQQVNGYQDADSLYCVAATYGLDKASLEGNKVPFYKGTVISVNNYANRGGVNQNVQAGEDAPILCARVGDEPGKLSVAPCFLPNIAAGPYWIAGIGRAQDGKYQWAVIIGGQPKEFAPDGKCTTKVSGINNSGLWLFSRTPVASAQEIADMEQVLEDQGISKALLRDVVQTGCTYEGAVIKA